MRKIAVTLTAAATALLVSPGLFAGPKQPPARLAQAQYVALGYDLGDRFVSEIEGIANRDVLTEDRKALSDVRDELKKWNRYLVVERPAQAELLIAVRTGRRASVGVGAPVGGRRPSGATTGRVELSSRDDMLSVYEAGSGLSGLLLWRGQRPGGLSSDSRPSLFDDFRSAVESMPKRP